MGSAGWTIEVFLLCCCISDIVPFLFRRLSHLADSGFFLSLLLSIPVSILEAVDSIIRTILYIGLVAPPAGVLFLIIICDGSILMGTFADTLTGVSDSSGETKETTEGKTVPWYEKIPEFVFLESRHDRYRRVYTGMQPDPRVGMIQLEYYAEDDPRDRIIIKKQYISGCWADSSKGKVYWQP